MPTGQRVSKLDRALQTRVNTPATALENTSEIPTACSEVLNKKKKAGGGTLSGILGSEAQERLFSLVRASKAQTQRKPEGKVFSTPAQELLLCTAVTEFTTMSRCRQALTLPTLSQTSKAAAGVPCLPPTRRCPSVFPVDGQGSREHRAWMPRALKLTGCYEEKPAALTSSGPPSSLHQDELLSQHRLQLYLFPVSSSQPLDLSLCCQGAL